MSYQFQPQRPGGSTASAPALLGQVLGISGLGLCLTALASYLFEPMNLGLLGLGALLLGFVLLIAINATRANEPLSLMLFYAFTFLEGIGISPTIAYYTHTAGTAVVYNAALTTGLGMFALAAVVYSTSIDFRRFQGILMLGLMAIILISVVSIFVHFVSPTAISWVVLVIFAGLTLVDFTRIRAGGDGYTPVQLAVQIYLDAINIFLALLTILGGRRSRD
ncbi:MAG TPA: Bax inhibitor-1 family protein [Candidatus Dormibacteraeota bacterium]|nr:Bax inhibitor-1 family protein [Candidatus Dormibacteraeota bacterium]